MFFRASLETPNKPGNGGFSRVGYRLQTPKSLILGRQLPKVSSHVGEYSRFAETFGGD
jgi:hypothetical protein